MVGLLHMPITVLVLPAERLGRMAECRLQYRMLTPFKIWLARSRISQQMAALGKAVLLMHSGVRITLAAKMLKVQDLRSVAEPGHTYLGV